MEKHPSSLEKTELPPSGNFENDSERIEKEPFEYKILKGHFMPDSKTYKSDQHVRMDYLTMTDALIQKMTEGSYDVAVYLDKSGRPLSHLVRAMWPTFARDIKTNETPPMPDFRFVNIDREQWIKKLDREGSGILDIDNLDPSIVRGLRSVFIAPGSKHQIMENGLNEDTDALPTQFDGKRVLIIDETYSTGRTAKIALDMFQRAFPLAEVKATHWMKETYRKNGLEFNAVPPWYNKEKVWGRGVNDRFGDFYATEKLDTTLVENYYRTFGRHFLSAPHWFAVPHLKDSSDHKYLQLLDEFQHLSKYPDVPLIPALSRPDRDERIIAYNTGLSPYSMSENEQDTIIATVAQEKRSINEESDKMSLKN